jgi:cytochrome P450
MPESLLATPATPLPGPFTPPTLRPPERAPSLAASVRAFRTNALLAWPRAAYEEWATVRPFLSRRSALVNDPAAIREVLVEGGVDRFARSPATVRLLRPMVGRGLFLSDGPAWRHQRRTLAPAFTPRTVGLLVPAMRAAIGESLDRIAAAAEDGRPVDLLGACQSLALEAAGRAMFSLRMRRYGGSLRAAVYAYGRSAAPRLLDLILSPDLITPRDVVRRHHGRRWMALVQRMLDARHRLAPPEPDLLSLIESTRDPETGAGFDAEAVRDQMATMVLAGHETTALTIFWALTLLAQAPAWQERIAAEARAAGTEDTAALKLTRAVVEETLRLYPPAFALVRIAKRPETVAGATLRPGDAVVIAPWVLHRHRRLWEAPDAFDPRRFLPPNAPPDRFAYLPFGAGPRACIGAQFALVEATLAVAMAAARFRFALAGKRPVLPVAIVTTTPDHAPPFLVMPREAGGAG